MNDRIFDYDNVSRIYKNMQKIVGDERDKDSIAGILKTLDEDIHENIDVENEAISGDLGYQLLLDWDNTSANFNEFIANFQNWAALVSKTTDNYKQFEEQVNGLKTSNPLGITNQSKETINSNSYYENYSSNTSQENNSSKSAGTIMGIAGASLALGTIPTMISPLIQKESSVSSNQEFDKSLQTSQSSNGQTGAKYVTKDIKGILTIYK